MRTLCLWFRQWPAQRVRVAASADEARAVLVHALERNLPRVVARNLAAAKCGVTIGMPLVEADTLLEGTGPVVAPLDVGADLAELRRLAHLCGRFGPVAGVEAAEPPESILVDVTGCEPFFGGERGLVRAAIAFIDSEGYVARAGLADTIGLAWAAARSSGQSRIEILPPGDGADWLACRPVNLLRLDVATQKSLADLGLRSVGDVLRLPRADLPSRFGPALLQRLDQALGRQPELIEGVRHVEPLSADWSSETPLTEQVAVECVLARLLEELLSRLARWEAIAVLVCRFGDRPGPVVRPATPSRSAERLLILLRLRLDRDPLPREIAMVQLKIETACLPPATRTSLFTEEREALMQARDARRLVERLVGRLGEAAVLSPVRNGDPLPERSLQLRPALSGPATLPGRAADPVETPEEVWTAASRPILLLPEPEPVQVWSVVPDGPPFRLRLGDQEWELTVALGPERLEVGWIDGPEARRDYWRCETERGERLWLFRCRRTERWFLHGQFA
jgi:protein ImuB